MLAANVVLPKYINKMMSKKYIGVNMHNVEGRKGHYVYYQNSSPSLEMKRLHLLLEVVDRRIDVLFLFSCLFQFSERSVASNFLHHFFFPPIH